MTSRTVDGVQVMVVVLRFVVSFVSTSNVAAIVAFATSGRGTSVPSSARVPERIVGTLTPVHADAGRAFGTKGAGAECVGALDPMVASVADRRRVPMARRPTAPQRRRIGMATPPTRADRGGPATRRSTGLNRVVVRPGPNDETPGRSDGSAPPGGPDPPSDRDRGARTTEA